MAALLVVAIVPAMTPPHALPCEKIPPFYLFPYFWFATLAAKIRCGLVFRWLALRLRSAGLALYKGFDNRYGDRPGLGAQ